MNKNKRINLMQGALRAGVCLFMLSGACVVSAHSGADQKDVKTASTAVAKDGASTKYEMRKVSGHVYDAATKAPLAGVRVQALNNRYYTALTDDNGAYTIEVPEYVTSLYVSVPEYNAVQIAIKDAEGQDAFLYSTILKGYYEDGTNLLTPHELNVENSSALTIENDIENHLNSTVRTISRGGMPAQGAAMFINGLNSLNTVAQPLVVVDGVIWDMQYDRSTLHDGFVNNVFNIIDTEDIENVQILKNGTALYGAKGANGVILINTKRGKSLVTRINIRAYGGFELVPDKTSVMNATQYRNYVTEFLGTTPEADEYFKNPSNLTPAFMNEDKNYLFYDVYHNAEGYVP